MALREFSATRTYSAVTLVPSQNTYHLPLEEAKQGFEIFKHKKDNCIKVMLKP